MSRPGLRGTLSVRRLLQAIAVLAMMMGNLRTVTHAAVLATMYAVAVLSLHVRAVPTGLARLAGYRKPKG